MLAFEEIFRPMYLGNYVTSKFIIITVFVNAFRIAGKCYYWQYCTKHLRNCIQEMKFGSFLNVGNNFAKEQFGFWNGFSLENALYKFIDEIVFVLNTAMVMGGMCCNFAEAFDFVDLELLLQNNIAYYCLFLYSITKLKKNTVFRQKPLIVVHWCEIVPVWLSLFYSFACYRILLSWIKKITTNRTDCF